MPGKLVGYARVSSDDQNLERQFEQLWAAKVDKIFSDQTSGKTTERPQLQAMLNYLREEDTLVVCSMDRLARNLADLKRLVDDLNTKGIIVRFLKENLSFSGDDTPMSKLLLNLLGAVAEFERELIKERQREGVAIAKKAGKYKGRKRVLVPDQVAAIRQRLADGAKKAELARELGISRETLYQYLRASVSNGAQHDEGEPR
jgi:DNA invertase Pin-like site-specific DNA recombinase